MSAPGPGRPAGSASPYAQDPTADLPPASRGTLVRAGLLAVLTGDKVVLASADFLLDEVGFALGQLPLPPAGADAPATLAAVLDACLADYFGLDALVRAVGQLTPRTGTPDALRALADEWNALRFFPDADWSALHTLLDGLVPVALPRLLQDAGGIRPLADTAGRVTDAWQAAVHLADFNAPPSGLPPALAFLLALAHDPATLRVRGEEWSAALEAWAQRWAVMWSVEEEFARRQAAVRESGAAPAAAPLPVLVLELVPSVYVPGRYLVSSWLDRSGSGRLLVRGDEGEDVSIDEVPDVVSRRLAAFEDLLGDGPAPTVEFIVPLHLLGYPARVWGAGRIGPDSAGRSYPLVVRSHERLRTPRWHRVWRRRWSILDDSPQGARVRWNSAADREAPGVMERELRSAYTIVACVLSAPPTGEYDTEVVVALRTGVPILLWDAADSPRPGFRAAAEELLAAGPLRELPARVAGAGIRTEGGGRVALLWDAPTRVPPVLGLRAPGQAP